MPSFFERIEDQKRIKTLKSLAKIEYEASRGIQHLVMLKEARGRLTGSLKRYEKKIRDLSNDLENTQIECQTKLRITLEKQLIKSHITEIPGIGQSLGSTILHSVYRNTIHDLWHASAYNGIGQTKQHDINRWVAKYDRVVPVLLKQDFPGKNAIISEANTRAASLKSDLIKWQTEQAREEEKLKRVTEEIDHLEKVTIDDFIKARVEHEGDLAQIDSFINGVFSEWEAMPEWFKEVIQYKEEENV